MKTDTQINNIPVQSEVILVNVTGFWGKVLVPGAGYRGGFYEKLWEACPTFDKASASWL